MVSSLTHWNVQPYVRVAAQEVSTRFGSRWNTYPRHGVPSGGDESRATDHWGPSGRGDPLPEHVGDAICSWVLGQHQILPVRVLIWWSWWWRPGVGWKPYSGFHGNHGPGSDAHVHVLYW